MVVVFDMDDVLVNLNEAWISNLNSTYNLKVKHEDICEWDMKVAFPTLTEEQLYGCLHDKEFWKSVKPLPFAEELLKKCEQYSNIDYYIVTAALPKNFYLKYENCFKVHFPFISSKRLICCNNKKLIDCNIIVDDNPDNFKYNDLLQSPLRLLMDKPWNKNANPKSYNYRVTSLEFVSSIIEDYIKYYL